ncbi:MAG: ATP-binding cassette domain-containing protein [Chloroflexi bacterium]|nr:ATP-binding cassette domain-containing protein [Chloroflexota bacterium]
MSIKAQTLIEVSEISKSYGDREAVKNLSFSVAEGTVLGLLGANGAGKTTIVNMLTTLTSIDTGHASICGYDVSSQPYEIRQLIGLAGQFAAIDEKLTARENLKLFGRLNKISGRNLNARIDDLLQRFRMADFADQIAGTCSGGQRRRLDVVSALIAKPATLFLDEPTTGLDPRSRADIWEVIEDLADEGTSVLLTTQYLHEADRLADEIVLIDHGMIVASGTPDELKRELNRDVLEIHLDSDVAFRSAVRLVNDQPDIGTDENAMTIRIPLSNGAVGSLALLRRLDDAGVTIRDFQVRRPTLDDVFLAFTDA